MFDWLHRRCHEVAACNHAEIEFLRTLTRDLQERNDRLTEALAQKSGVDLVLPGPQTPRELEKGLGGYWDKKPFPPLSPKEKSTQ